MGLPGGFKPNHNLSQFIGCAILDMIYTWNYVTTGLNQMQVHILWYAASTGLLGLTTMISLVHDIFFMCSFHIFMPYTVVAYIYKNILKMLGTLFNLFNGKKFNIMRNRVDANDFSI